MDQNWPEEYSREYCYFPASTSSAAAVSGATGNPPPHATNPSSQIPFVRRDNNGGDNEDDEDDQLRQIIDRLIDEEVGFTYFVWKRNVLAKYLLPLISD